MLALALNALARASARAGLCAMLGAALFVALGSSVARAAEPDVATGLGAPSTGYAEVYASPSGNDAFGIKADGTVWGWGANSQGQLGNGTTTSSNIPVQLSTLTGARQVAVGGSHGIALQADGTVWTWGDNTYGQLGNGTTTASLVPIQVPGISNARLVAAGSGFSIAVKADGTIWTWGSNTSGQLGNGSGPDQSSPVQVAGLSGVRQVAVGDQTTMVITGNGTVWAWGLNTDGEIGNGTTSLPVTTPTQATALTGARQVALGQKFGMAIKADGSVWAWGDNINGQFGNGTTTASPTPVQIAAYAGARRVSLGGTHTLVLMGDGSVHASGYNGAGQLGDGTFTQQPTPVTIASIAGSRTIQAGAGFSLAISAAGVVSAWGSDGFGQLGDGGSSSRTTPASSNFTLGCGYVQFATSANAGSTMAIRSDGTVWAWGDDYYGQLADGNTSTTVATPEHITALDGARQISMGSDHGIAIKADGTVWAWGSNYYGELGQGSTGTAIATPVQIPALTGAREVLMSAYHAMAIKADGTVWAWGINSDGRLGIGNTTDQYSPTQVTGMTGARSLALGSYHSLGMKSDGTVWAWGGGSSGQLGQGSTASQSSPVQVAAAAGARELATGQSTSGAILGNGSTLVWGSNTSRQLGLGTTTDQLTATTLGVPTAIHLTMGFLHGFSTAANGDVWGWGNNASGALGDGTLTNQNTPVVNASLHGMLSQAAANDFSAGLAPSGALWTWGSDGVSELGYGSTNQSSPGVVSDGCAAPPTTPTNVSPTTGTAASTPTLTASAFSDPNGDAHQASQWQVRTNAGTYAAPLADSGVTTTSKTSWVEPTALTAGQTYWFHVRYQDATNLWTPYSTETSFVYDPNAPLASTLVTPANAANTTSPALTATYQDAAPATNGRVEFQVCTTGACGTVLESGFSSTVASGSNGTWSHSRLSGTYFWRARGVDVAGNTGPWTATWSFTYAQPPVTPTLVTPTNAAWVTSPSPTLTATYSDPDGDAGVDLFQWCRTNAGATDWSNVANCATGFGGVTSASGASGVNKSATPASPLGQGDWYWRAASRDVGGGISAFSVARLVRIDSLPPTPVTGVSIQRSGLGKVTASWNPSTDAGIGFVTYDMDWSSDGTTWSSVCAGTTSLTCQKTGLGGGSLPFVRIRACDSLGNCTTWQGRVGGSASGYYLRTGTASAVLTNAANKQATIASGTANSSTTQRIDSGEVGWMQVKPGVLSSANPVASEPAGTPAPATGSGWIIDSTAGATLAAGPWTAQVTTDASTGSGVARLQCRAWIVTVSAGSITASSNYQSAFTDNTDIYQIDAFGVPGTCTLPGLATQTTLAANQYVYFELYIDATSGPTTNNERMNVHAEGLESAISLPPSGVAPNLPTITSPATNALSDPTIDVTATYSHPAATQGTLEYEFATDAAFTNIVQTGSSALLASGATPTFTTDALPAGAYFWHVRAVDTSSLVSAWTANRTITVSSAPATPTNTAPTDNGSTSLTTPTLTSSAFSDVDTGLGDSHTASQWQLAVDGSDWTTGQDSGVSGTSLTSWTPTALTPGTTYWWHVRYRDAYGQWSAYSAITRFTVTAGGSTTLSLDTTALNLGVQTTNVDTFGTFIATVSTTNATGYQLTASGTATGSDGTTCGGCATPFADWTGTDATPTVWAASTAGASGYFGITVRGASGARLAKWGAGNNWPQTDVTNNKYAGVGTGALTLHQTATTTASDTVTTSVRLDPSATTSSGAHSETIAVTVVANP